MKPRSAHHHTFVIEREFAYPPALVFHAFSHAEAKKAWFSGPSDWDVGPSSLDFRVGGHETSSGGPKGGFVSTYDAIYLDIVPDERIITAFTMLMDGTPITTSMATIEFQAGDYGTKTVYTEQIAFLDGSDHLKERIEGTEAMFDLLTHYLTGVHGEHANA